MQSCYFIITFFYVVLFNRDLECGILISRRNLIDSQLPSEGWSCPYPPPLFFWPRLCFILEATHHHQRNF